MAQQAQETFVAELSDGSTRRVVRGEVLPDNHELVRRDRDGSGLLFRPLDIDEEPPPVPVVKAPVVVKRAAAKGA